MSADTTTPTTGQTDSCRVCGQEIVFQGHFWTHTGSPQPRHQAVRMSGSGHAEMSAFDGDIEPLRES